MRTWRRGRIGVGWVAREDADRHVLGDRGVGFLALAVGVEFLGFDFEGDVELAVGAFA